jgi:hypothetical protein
MRLTDTNMQSACGYAQVESIRLATECTDCLLAVKIRSEKREGLELHMHVISVEDGWALCFCF